MRKINYAFFFALLASFFWSTVAFSQSATPSPHMWITNGNVYAVALDGDYAYLGGDFTKVGANSGFGAKITTSSDSPNLNYQKVNGVISIAVPDGSGGWYIGGNFTKVGTEIRNRLARINSDGSLHAWNPDANGLVYSIAVSGDAVYVGGDFSTIGGQNRSRLAKLNSSGTLDPTWLPEPTSSGTLSVRTIAISGDGNDIYVGGFFTSIGGQSRNYIAKLNNSNGNADAGWNPNASNSVSTIALNGSDIYVGGSFNTIGGQPRSNIAKLNTSNGDANTSWQPDANSSVSIITVNSNGSDVYAAGVFTSIGGQTRNYIAKLNTGNGNADATWNPVLDASVGAIKAIGNDIYIGGFFTSINSQTKNYLARIDNSTGAVDGTWDPNPNTTVYTIAISGNDIYTGGAFTFMKSQTRNRIARFSTIDGAVDASWNPDANGIVRTIAVSGSSVYAGGEFTTIGGQTRNRIAKLNNTNGAANVLWNANASSFVFTIAVSSDGNDIYAGGAFNGTNSIGGQTRNRIAKLNNSDGAADLSWDANANGIVRTIVIDGTSIYVGGEFKGTGCIGGQWRNYIARLNNLTGTADDWNPNPSASFNATVHAIAISGTSVFAGGEFTSIGGQARNRIAKLSSTTNTNNADASWNPNVNNFVYTIAISGSYVYIGGIFTTINSVVTQNRIARLSPTGTGTVVSWNPNPGISGTSAVRALKVNGSDVYVGGEFLYMNSVTQPYFALFTDRTLPVKLSSFTAKAENRNVSLKWQTESEMNNYGFNIERKSGADSWEEIGFVKGSGTINTPVNYEFKDKSLTTGKYQYRLKQVDFNGNFEYHSLSGEVEIGVPAKFELSQNYPNPFNPATKIDFALPVDSKVSLMVYDISGREVKHIMNNEFTKAGYHTAQFDATGLSSGVYFYRIIAGNNVISKKMLLIK